jgi:hypothetical protein
MAILIPKIWSAIKEELDLVMKVGKTYKKKEENMTSGATATHAAQDPRTELLIAKKTTLLCHLSHYNNWPPWWTRLLIDQKHSGLRLLDALTRMMSMMFKELLQETLSKLSVLAIAKEKPSKDKE